MPTRIGGPVLTGPGGTFNPRLKTWGDMRSPIILYGFVYNASITEFSRQFPVTNPESSHPYYFKWNSGSLFRHDSQRRPFGILETAYFYIFANPEIVDPPEAAKTWWGIGVWYNLWQAIDNHDFLQLIGEPIDTDVGTFIINADAHDPNNIGQILTDNPGEDFTQRKIYAIGKLTGF